MRARPLLIATLATGISVASFSTQVSADPGAGMIVGGAIGAVVGGPPGAAAGALIGGAIGADVSNRNNGYYDPPQPRGYYAPGPSAYSGPSEYAPSQYGPSNYAPSDYAPPPVGYYPSAPRYYPPPVAYYAPAPRYYAPALFIGAGFGYYGNGRGGRHHHHRRHR